ncbi:hypothetical protein ABPG74_001937 [Tetrahymena malaccensis]
MFKLLQHGKKKLNFTLSNYQQYRAQGIKAIPHSFTQDNKQLLKSQFLFKNLHYFSQNQKNEYDQDQDQNWKYYGSGLPEYVQKIITIAVCYFFIDIIITTREIDKNKPVVMKHIEKYKKETDEVQQLEYAYDLIELQKSFTLGELKYIERELKENNFLLLSIIQSQIAALLLKQPEKGGNLEQDSKQQNQDQLKQGQDYVEKSFKNLCQVIKNNSSNDFDNLQNLSEKNKSIHELSTKITVDTLINLQCTQNDDQKKYFKSIFEDNTRLYPQLAYKIEYFQ